MDRKIPRYKIFYIILKMIQKGNILNREIFKIKKKVEEKMEFLGRMMDSFSTAGQDVAKKAKNATESVKLNNQMKANERMIKKLIYQVGMICFENQGKECCFRRSIG